MGCILSPLRGWSLAILFRNISVPSRNFRRWAQLEQQGGAASGDRLLLEGQQDRGLVFDGAAEAEPGGQRDTARGLGRKVADVEDDQAKASAFEQQVGGAEKLLQTAFGGARVSGVCSKWKAALRGGKPQPKIRQALGEEVKTSSRKVRARNGAPACFFVV